MHTLVYITCTCCMSQSEIATFTVCRKTFRKLQSWIIMFSPSRKVLHAVLLHLETLIMWWFIWKVEIVLCQVKFLKIIKLLIFNVSEVPEITQSYQTDVFNMEIATWRGKAPHKICIFICIFQSSLMPNPLQSHLSSTFIPNISLKWILWNTEILVAVAENGWAKMKIAFPFHCCGELS